MSHIAPLPHDAITDPELRALIAEGEALGVPDDQFARIVARAYSRFSFPMKLALISAGQTASHS